MYDTVQSIREPFGVTVFGSALVRVEPDVASLFFTVSRSSKHPKDAFAAVRKGAEGVSRYLNTAGVPDVRSSRVTLEQEYSYSGGERRFVGYSAQIGFNAFLADLDRVEEVLTGVVDAGANQINSVSFETTNLKENRVEARTRAVQAAREKAEIYASSAGVSLGAVLHIEDVNPDVLTGRSEGHVTVKVDPDDVAAGAIDPGAIVVGGAVHVSFAILTDPTP